MAEAIFGLVGVLIGGLITGGTAFWLIRRRERAAARGACRLLWDELGTAQVFFEACLEADKWLDEPSGAVTNDLWLEQRGVLAGEHKFTPWFPVTGAYAGIEMLIRRISFPDVKKGDALGERGRAWLEIQRLGTKIAKDALLDYAKTPFYAPDNGKSSDAATDDQDRNGDGGGDEDATARSRPP